MAEINQTKGGQKSPSGKVRVKRLSTRIDMTPMVDLAFLLLTFFILTSTLTKPPMLQVEMPDDSGPTEPINEKNILNLVLAENNKIYWWIGLEPPVEETNYSKEGVRKLLLDRKKENPKLMVLIKTHDNAKYENIVDILDEMVITHMDRYAMVDVTNEDEMMISGNMTKAKMP